MRFWVGALAWAAAAFLGCGGEQAARTVGVLSFTDGDPVSAAVERELKLYAAERGVRAVWIDETDFDPKLPREENVLRALDKMIEKRIEALILRRTEQKYAKAAIRELREREIDIPILFLDAMPSELSADAFITADYKAAGREAAEYALQRAHERRKRERRTRSSISPLLNVVVVEGKRGSREDRLAAAGLYSVLDNDPNVRIVARYSPKDSSDAFSYVSRQLQKYADNIQALLAANPEFASPAVFAAAARGSAGSIESAGVGSSQETSRRILAGEHDMDINLMPAAAAPAGFGDRAPPRRRRQTDPRRFHPPRTHLHPHLLRPAPTHPVRQHLAYV